MNHSCSIIQTNAEMFGKGDFEILEVCKNCGTVREAWAGGAQAHVVHSWLITLTVASHLMTMVTMTIDVLKE